METEKQTIEAVELNQRHSDRLTVTLWWVQGTMDTYVTVLDHVDGGTKFIPVVPPATAHDVYNHPFAYKNQGQDV